jgi:hypothetical protein
VIELKPLQEIAGAQNGWLKAKHHFTVGRYGNPAHLPIGKLYVFNDDEFAPHSGFDFHHHANAEIITYVRQGTVTHHRTCRSSSSMIFRVGPTVTTVAAMMNYVGHDLHNASWNAAVEQAAHVVTPCELFRGSKPGDWELLAACVLPEYADAPDSRRC